MNRKTTERKREAIKRRLQKKRIIVCLVCLLAVLSAAALLRSYPATDAAHAVMPNEKLGSQVTVFAAEAPKAGLIFYPGGLVEHEAYAPLMREIASRGITCLLVQMPLDLAVLDINAAQGLAQKMPEIDRWMIGGHSLGGAMASSYAAKHPDDFEALVLLGAYAPKDLSDTALDVLSVLGSEDGVVNRKEYEECRVHYPESFKEFVIEGGCHAFFGNYGMQKGDGNPAISRGLQMGMTASAIAAMIGL